MKNFSRQIGLGLLILACVGCAALAQQSPQIEIADDLAALGKLSASRQTPIMLVFTQADCPYCASAKKEHLEPLRTSRSYGTKVFMREIETDNKSRPLHDFDGNRTTHGDFTRKYDVRSVPTVIVVDATGKLLANPIVGLTNPDFYKLYLEQAVDAARVQLRHR